MQTNIINKAIYKEEMLMKIVKLGNMKSEQIVALVFRLLLICGGLTSICTKNWLNLFTVVLAFVLSYMPETLNKTNKVYLPSSFQVIILLFIFGSIYLGELKGFYQIFWWWDILLHTCSGLILGFLGFLLTYTLNEAEKVHVAMSPFYVAFFAFTFAVAMGALWEIFEFTMDNTLGMMMQLNSLNDTMLDLIVDTAGALFSASIGYAYMKNQKEQVFRKFFCRSEKIKNDNNTKSM